LLCSFDPGTGSFLSFLVPPGSWFCRARKERGVLFVFGAIRASHTPQTPTNIARKRRESRLAERGKSAGLERASRSHILAGPTGACRCGPDPGRDHQKAEKRPQRSDKQSYFTDVKAAMKCAKTATKSGRTPMNRGAAQMNLALVIMTEFLYPHWLGI
ncbi:hypothetical protein NDU88_004051, partial [Pleurodeles waltl]